MKLNKKILYESIENKSDNRLFIINSKIYIFTTLHIGQNDLFFYENATILMHMKYILHLSTTIL